jgi:hypothetical protein
VIAVAEELAVCFEPVEVVVAPFEGLLDHDVQLSQIGAGRDQDAAPDGRAEAVQPDLQLVDRGRRVRAVRRRGCRLGQSMLCPAAERRQRQRVRVDHPAVAQHLQCDGMRRVALPERLADGTGYVVGDLQQRVVDDVEEVVL